MLYGGPAMCYRDKGNLPVSVGDIVELDDRQYIIRFIEEYIMATTVIVENVKTHQIETLLLHDIRKI